MYLEVYRSAYRDPIQIVIIRRVTIGLATTSSTRQTTLQQGIVQSAALCSTQ